MFNLFRGLKRNSDKQPASESPRLPVSLVRLCEALQPIQLKLAKKIEEKYYPRHRVIQTTEPADSISLSLYEITILYPQLEKWLEPVNRDILSNEHLNTWLLNKTIKEGEFIIDRIAAIYHRAHLLDVSGEDKEAADWLAALVKRNLIEINNWLIGIIEVVTNPGDLSKYKSKRHKDTITVNMQLVLSSGPEVRKLKKYMKRKNKEEEAKNFDASMQENTGQKGWSPWTWGILGLFIGSTFFGGDKDCD